MLKKENCIKKLFVVSIISWASLAINVSAENNAIDKAEFINRFNDAIIEINDINSDMGRLALSRLKKPDVSSWSLYDDIYLTIVCREDSQVDECTLQSKVLVDENVVRDELIALTYALNTQYLSIDEAIVFVDSFMSNFDNTVTNGRYTYSIVTVSDNTFISIKYIDSATVDTRKLSVDYISSVQVGNTLEFGTYEQDGDISNGAEAIQWKAISVEEGKVTLLSEYNLECKKYNDVWENISWEDCSLRTWLNNDFYNNAFSISEKKAIVAHPDTNDLVSILSADEWRSCGTLGISGGTPNTEYAIGQGVFNDSGTGWSWLRDEGIDKDHAQEIDCTGSVNTYGSFVDCDNDGVRPVIIISGGN